MKLCGVVYLDASLGEAAEKLATEFAVSCVEASAQAGLKARAFQRYLADIADSGRSEEAGGRSFFVMSKDRLRLQVSGDASSGAGIYADFHGPTVSYRRKQGGGRGQSIAKAVGLRGGWSPRVLDATAGLGGDAFVLASLGCEVRMLERVPEVRALLVDGLAQARRYALAEDASLLPVLDRMTLEDVDARDYMGALGADAQPEDRPDVIYLDPMFPVRTKSALVKKEMRVFHSLVGADADADELLERALRCARYRVVVKRPRIAPSLIGPAPNHVFEGKSNRFDVYTSQRLPDGTAVLP